jgi:hypothetical protein
MYRENYWSILPSRIGWDWVPKTGTKDNIPKITIKGLTAKKARFILNINRRCRDFIVGFVVGFAKSVLVQGKIRFLVKKRENPEMIYPIRLSWEV